jgi:hypothetical protein
MDGDVMIGVHPTNAKLYFGNTANYFTRGQIHTTATELSLNNNYSTGYIKFKTYDGEAMRILNSGNVGIGIDNPTEKLEVDGNIKASGSIIFEGTTDEHETILSAIDPTSDQTYRLPNKTGGTYTLATMNDVPTNNNQLTNGAGYISEEADPIFMA